MKPRHDADAARANALLARLHKKQRLEFTPELFTTQRKLRGWSVAMCWKAADLLVEDGLAAFISEGETVVLVAVDGGEVCA